ncbi:MAG: polysaccharide biosynthesis tyrosine autokinase [Pseudomonadota bacterium]
MNQAGGVFGNRHPTARESDERGLTEILARRRGRIGIFGWETKSMDKHSNDPTADKLSILTRKNPIDPVFSGADREFDLGRLVGILWQSKFRVATSMLAGLVGAALLYANTPPTYQADALLQLEQKGSALSVPTGLVPLIDDAPRSETEIEILRSRMVLGQAVAELNLDWVVSPALLPVAGNMLARYRVPLVDQLVPVRYARPGESLTLAQLVVPPNWLNQKIVVTSQGGGKFTLTTPLGQVLRGAAGQLLELPDLGFALKVESLNAPSGRVYLLSQLNEKRAIDGLGDRLSVSERGRSSGIIGVRVTGEDLLENASVLNAIIGAYQRQNIARSAAQADGSLTFLRDQQPAAEQKLRAAEDALKAFRQEKDSVDLSMETQTILAQVSRVEGELSDLKSHEDELAMRYKPSHPTYRLLLEKRQSLESELAGLRDQVKALPDTQRQLVNLTSDLELAQKLYTDLLTRSQQVEVLRASTIGNVRIIDDAVPTEDAVAPHLNVMLGLGMALGAILGVMFVLVHNWLAKRIQDVADLEQRGLLVLGTINYNRAADTYSRRSQNLPVFAITEPNDLTTEAFRSLRTSLHFGMLDAESPILTVTSTHPRAGKSFLAANLAVVAAQAGQRVCLIDADLRRGQLRRYFGLPRTHAGLAEVLAGDIQPQDAIFSTTQVAGLSVLTTGRYPPNPSELLMRAELSKLIEWCGQNFDLTIFDSPPVLAVTDPVILARRTGATLLVARHGVTLAAEIDSAINTFASVDLRFSGAVLNAFDPRKATEVRSKGYGYGYRYSYPQRQD